LLVKPRLLFISPRFLFPLDQGGRIRTANTLRHMKGGAFDITLMSPVPLDAERFAEQTAALCDRFLPWPEVPMSRLRRAMALAGKLPVAVATDASIAGQKLIAGELSKRPDVVLVDFPHAAVLLPDRLAVPSLVFTHNVEAEIFSRHAQVIGRPMRWIWRDQARKMRRFEGHTLRRFDTVITVSVRDADALRESYGLQHVEPVETGVDVDYYAYHAPDDAPAFGPAEGTVVFTGSMDSRSNIEGVTFLMREVWPLVLQTRPQARVIIVGRNPPDALVAEAAARGLAWEFSGFVGDVRPYVARAHVYVIPLRVGSGTRIKVFEAMAMGCPIVSTSLGVEGLAVKAGIDHLAADTAPEFSTAVLTLLDHASRREAIASAARALVVEYFDWNRVTQRFETLCLGVAGFG
jgi:glycosyltransferase involved in cell wall biosynthesis